MFKLANLEALEAREVPSIVPPSGLTFPAPPDYAGGSPTTARAVSLPVMQWQTVSDHLPSASDVDFYRVQLNKGDFLVADVDPNGRVALNSTLAVLNAAGAQVAWSRYGTEPESNVFSFDPAVGYYAPEGGTYFVKVATTATDYSPGRGYNLNLERVGVEDTNVAPYRLRQGGTGHAWLNAGGDTLHVTGPTGYGFSLRGNWTKTRSGDAVTYTATGTLYLRSTYLSGSVGEIAVQVPALETFRVKTRAPGWDQLGEITSVGGRLGLSVEPYAADIEQAIGVDLSDVAIGAKWTIKTGAQVKAEYQSHIQTDIAQVLDGVPYLVYGDAGSLKLNFGKVNLTANDQSKLVMIADPADPMLYVGYKDYAFAGSLNGRIPFNTTVSPPAESSVPLDSSLPGVFGRYGHVYAAGEFPLSGLPLSVHGDVTVDLDADDNGQFLGGAGNASQLFRGDLSAVEAVLRDINVGINGGLNLGYSVAGYGVTVPLGEASAFYSGPRQGVWFEGAQGTAVNPWAGTALEDFQIGPGTTVEGYAYRDGRFSVSTTSSYKFFTLDAALTVTVTNESIWAGGSVTTPIGRADVSGWVGFNGDFAWSGQLHIDIGGGNNYLRGTMTVGVSKTGSEMKFTVAVQDAVVKLTDPTATAKVEGRVNGTLTVKVKSDGRVSYAANLHLSAGIYVRNPFTGGWKPIGSASGSLDLSGNALKFSDSGYDFSLGLPG
jgi:hypothetical protein